MAYHCMDTSDRLIYIPQSFGWNELAACLNEYDGPWRTAIRIVIDEREVSMIDSDGGIYRASWYDFGIDASERP